MERSVGFIPGTYGNCKIRTMHFTEPAIETLLFPDHLSLAVFSNFKDPSWAKGDTYAAPLAPVGKDPNSGLPFVFGHLVVASDWLEKLIPKDRTGTLSGPVIP
jgi:hypothetical protein